MPSRGIFGSSLTSAWLLADASGPSSVMRSELTPQTERFVRDEMDAELVRCSPVPNGAPSQR